MARRASNGTAVKAATPKVEVQLRKIYWSWQGLIDKKVQQLAVWSGGEWKTGMLTITSTEDQTIFSHPGFAEEIRIQNSKLGTRTVDFGLTLGIPAPK